VAEKSFELPHHFALPRKSIESAAPMHRCIFAIGRKSFLFIRDFCAAGNAALA
jgi:hypothetical protein